MNRITVFSLFMLLLGGCTDAAQEEALQAQQDASEQIAAVRASADEDAELAEAPASQTTADIDPATVSALRAVLRPIDTPLPDRVALEALVDAPVTALTGLLDDDDFLVRLNAARSLGRFGDVPGVTETLLAQATAPGRSAAERTAAVEGLAWLPVDWRAANIAALAPLLTDPEPTVGTATVYTLRDFPEGRSALESALTEGGLHPAVEHLLRTSIDAPAP